MNKFSILLKNNFIMMLNSVFNKKNNRSKIGVVAIATISIVAFWLLFYSQAYTQFASTDPKLALLNGFLIAFTVIVIYTSMKVTAKQKTNDTDLLLSLPISKRIVALSKIVLKYSYDFIMSFLIITPYLTLYFIKTGFNLKTFMLSLCVIILLPMLSTGLNYILNYIVTKLFNRLKYANLLKSVFALIIFAGFMYVFVVALPSIETANPTNLEAYIFSFFAVGLFLNFILDINLVVALKVLSLTVLPFIVGSLLYAKNLGKTFLQYKNKDATLKSSKKVSALHSLTKKEFKTYFTTPIYMLNTIVGPLFILGITIFIAIKGKTGLNEFLGIPVPNEASFAVLAIMSCFMIGMTLISANSISLEGKYLWLLQSTPVSKNKIFLSKTIPNLVLTVLPAVISGVVISVILKYNLTFTFLLIMLPVLVGVITSFSGLFINLLFPKLNWSQEEEVVKRSLSIVVSMLLSFIVSLLPIGIYFIFNGLSIMQIAFITLSIYILISALSVVLLFTKGKKLFQKL